MTPLKHLVTSQAIKIKLLLLSLVSKVPGNVMPHLLYFSITLRTVRYRFSLLSVPELYRGQRGHHLFLLFQNSLWGHRMAASVPQVQAYASPAHRPPSGPRPGCASAQCPPRSEMICAACSYFRAFSLDDNLQVLRIFVDNLEVSWNKAGITSI